MNRRRRQKKVFWLSIFLLLILGSYYAISEFDSLQDSSIDIVNWEQDFREAWENFLVYAGEKNLRATEKSKEEENSEDTKSADLPLLETSFIHGIGEWDEAHGLIRLGLLEVETNLEQNTEKAKQNVLPAITRISMGDYYGSGVILAILEEQIIMVSNEHVLNHNSDGEVTFFDGSKARGRVIGVSSEYDVGFMKVECADLDPKLIQKLRYAAMDEDCYRTLGKGDDVLLIGSTDGVAKNRYTGTIADMWWYIDDFDDYMIYTYCYAKPGMSGGGTFDAHGHYIGMVTGGNGSETASLPLITIAQEYKQITGRNLNFDVQESENGS